MPYVAAFDDWLAERSFCRLPFAFGWGASAKRWLQTTDELIVYGTVVTRNRTESTAPVLSYDLEYFQRFEPISAAMP